MHVHDFEAHVRAYNPPVHPFAHFSPVPGALIPRVSYTPAEVATWGMVYDKLRSYTRSFAIDTYNDIMPQLEAHCGYSNTNVPQLQDISDFLKSRTGFSIRPVGGLLSARDFLNALAFRVFFSTQVRAEVVALVDEFSLTSLMIIHRRWWVGCVVLHAIACSWVFGEDALPRTRMAGMVGTHGPALLPPDLRAAVHSAPHTAAVHPRARHLPRAAGPRAHVRRP